jgi:hypothetical protein
LLLNAAAAAVGKIASDAGDGPSSYQVPSGLTGNARPSGQTT